ncbi:hypothetical protein HH212_14795 [Massilia forsythiae]|uniref:SPOR domain-containing protein n=1 Tax=Massilia forsythiae TaxID=2728020 RepID=A0A7Z2VXV1_9BURK|nr:SPOR domain-containing protein [Massilia forsythiae]QJE01143.1 hypothetical protein HH212_14795 [Massilia forsythiae]
MGLFSFLNKNKQDRAADDSGRFYSKDEDAALNERARSKRAGNAAGGATRRPGKDPLLPEKKRARRRLVGAVALALAAAVGLPMLLDSEPKPPVAGDIAIQIPSKDKAGALPAPREPAPSDKAVAAEDSVDSGEEIVNEPPRTPSSRTPAALAAKPGAEPAPKADAARTDAPADTRAAEKAERLARERADRLERERVERALRADRDKLASEKAATDKAARDKARKAEQERADRDKLARDKTEQDRAEHDKAVRLAREKAEKAEHDKAERAEREKAERAERIARAKQEEKAKEDRPAKPAEGARALAILEGKPADKPKAADESGQRFVLQVAAMSSQEKAAEVQARLRGAGISSYTQKASTSSGELIRVLIGPMSRDEAEKVRAKAGKLGMSGALKPV